MAKMSKESKSKGGKNGDKAKKAAGGRAGGDRKRRGLKGDEVDGSWNKCGRPGKTKKGQNGHWSAHYKRVDGKPKYCGTYKPLNTSDPTPIPNQTLSL
jgi:hypothetical protein